MPFGDEADHHDESMNDEMLNVVPVITGRKRLPKSKAERKRDGDGRAEAAEFESSTMKRAQWPVPERGADLEGFLLFGSRPP